MTDSPHRPHHILLIDDDPLVVKVYAERMRYEGWTVAVARDGWEACTEARRTPFDMILLDIRMPLHNGMEVLKDIRSGKPNTDTPVYVLTSLSEGEDIDDALRLGASGVFYKSSTRPDDLVVEVERILGGGEVTESAADSELAVPEAGAEADQAERSADAVQEESGDGNFVVYVNPFLGDGARLASVLGLGNGYQCAACGGQVCLNLAPIPDEAPGVFAGVFSCGACGQGIRTSSRAPAAEPAKPTVPEPVRET